MNDICAYLVRSRCKRRVKKAKRDIKRWARRVAGKLKEVYWSPTIGYQDCDGISTQQSGQVGCVSGDRRGGSGVIKNAIFIWFAIFVCARLSAVEAILDLVQTGTPEQVRAALASGKT